MSHPFWERLLPDPTMAPKPQPEPAKGTARRREVLDQVASCVCRDRQNAYGDAEDNFQHIADYWTLWLRQRGLLAPTSKLEPYDVAMMSSQIKVARAAVNPGYLDNWVDGAGYWVCGGGIIKAQGAPTKAPWELDGDHERGTE